MKIKPTQRGKLHPIWNGIGCAMLVLIPLISWGLADVLVDYVFTTYPDIPLSIAKENPGIDTLYIKIGAAVILGMLLYLAFSILSSTLYSLLGGSKDAEIADRLGSGKQS